MAITFLATPPLNTPVSVAELRDYGRVDDDNDGDILQRNIETAASICENQTGRSLITKTFTVHSYQSEGIEIIHLPLIDVIEIRDIRVGSLGETVFKTFDVAGGASEFYTIDRSEITPLLNISSSIFDQDQVFQIDYTAGYGPDSADVPPDLREAVLGVALNLYENRGKMAMGMSVVPPDMMKLLQKYRTFAKVV